jgi:hypothetical protein
MPWLLLPVGLVAIATMGRARATWWFLPVLWPSTQWYYSLMAMPAITPVAAAILAVPVQGAPVVAAAVIALSLRPWRRHDVMRDWLDLRRPWQRASPG